MCHKYHTANKNHIMKNNCYFNLQNTLVCNLTPGLLPGYVIPGIAYRPDRPISLGKHAGSRSKKRGASLRKEHSKYAALLAHRPHTGRLFPPAQLGSSTLSPSPRLQPSKAPPRPKRRIPVAVVVVKAPKQQIQKAREVEQKQKHDTPPTGTHLHLHTK